MGSSAFAMCVVVMAAATAHADDHCVISGTHVTLSHVTVKTARHSFDVDISNVEAAVTVTGDIATLDVGGNISFTATVAHPIWYSAARGFDIDQVRFESGSNFVGEWAHGGEISGRAVLHASDVMQGEVKNPDVEASVVRAPCDELSLDWSANRVEARVAGTGRYYYPLHHANKLTLHRVPKDTAPTVRVVAPTCTGEGCLHFESISRRGTWIELAAVNEGIAVVGWTHSGFVTPVPADVGVGYAYGCTGDHEHFEVMRAPGAATHHDVRVTAGTEIYDAPNGEAWATVKHDSELGVLYAPGDTWAEVTAMPHIGLALARAYVPVSSFQHAKP